MHGCFSFYRGIVLIWLISFTVDFDDEKTGFEKSRLHDNTNTARF